MKEACLPIALGVGGNSRGYPGIIVGHIAGGVVVEREVVGAALQAGGLLGRESGQVRDALSHRGRVVSQKYGVCVYAQYEVQVALRRLLQDGG